MRVLGELSLLGAFVASGFAAFACTVGWKRDHRGLWRAGVTAAAVNVLALTALLCVLARALVTNDFGFAYVAQYSSKLLSWYYSLSALWVGQAGSLLLWAWLSAIVTVLFGFWPGRQACGLRSLAVGVLMFYSCFLVAIMVFAADPMEASISPAREGAGLSPLLQHPAMLLHPPIVFLGYALWTIPFSLAAAALITGQLDTAWLRQARPWAVGAWAVLGAGILLGAEWAYEELGWGGYWGWDPVENGSLIPWLAGTALIHFMMAWQYCGIFKRTALTSALAAFALCNFAAFLTRSGVFSSLHAFSASPIGWLFLGLMTLLAAGSAGLLVYRRRQLRPEKPIGSVLSREAFVLISAAAILLLAAVTLGGTLSAALSNLIFGQAVMMGTAFYNAVLIPTGLVLMATVAITPLLRWGGAPAAEQKRWLPRSLGAGGLAVAAAWSCGVRHPIELSVVGFASSAVVATIASLLLDAGLRAPHGAWRGLWPALRSQRRQYAGFFIHLGFVCLAIGVTGSSLGKRQQQMEMGAGETTSWAGYEIRLERLGQRNQPDKLIAEAEFQILQGNRPVATLLPAQHFHLLQQDWTTEVAIHSTWRSDVYLILHSGDGKEKVRLTLVENPMMRWLWLGGWIMSAGVLLRLWPARRRAAAAVVVRPAAETPPPAVRGRGLAAASWLLSLVLGCAFSPW